MTQEQSDLGINLHGERKLRVAYVCTDPGVPIFGAKGASVHVQGILTALVRMGADVSLFASSAGDQRPSELSGVEVRLLPDWPKGEHSGVARLVDAANSFLGSSLKENGPFDLIYERYALWSYAGMEHAAASRCPGLLEVNSPLIEEEQKYRNLKNKALSEGVARRVFRLASRLVAVSKGVADYLSSFPETKGKVHVIHNGVDPSRFPEGLRASLPAPPGVFTVGFVGTLKPWHGLETLSEGYRLLHEEAPEVRLLIVGDGPGREKLRDDLAAEGLSRLCVFTGGVAPSEVPALVASMDVGVAPYPDIAGFYFSPLKVLEYMAGGIPAVASRMGDLADLIEDGVDGFLVPPGDPVALANVLRRLMLDGRLQADVGLAARAKVLRLHSWDRVVQKVLDLCEITTSRGWGKGRMAE